MPLCLPSASWSVDLKFDADARRVARGASGRDASGGEIRIRLLGSDALGGQVGVAQVVGSRWS